jgi:hypothetical protein
VKLRKEQEEEKNILEDILHGLSDRLSVLCCSFAALQMALLPFGCPRASGKQEAALNYMGL